MRSAIVNEALSFPNEPTVVLLLNTGNIDGTEHLILAPVVGHQRTDHGLRVDLIGLRAFGASVDQQAGRIDHQNAEPGSDESAVQPESFVAGLVTAQDRRGRRADQVGGTRSKPVDETQQSGRVAPTRRYGCPPCSTWEREYRRPTSTCSSRSRQRSDRWQWTELGRRLPSRLAYRILPRE